MMTSAELRQAFLDFFSAEGHTIVPSSSLVPSNDPTLLFTNAGMVQFKDVFLGADRRPYTRAASAQRCVRAGGKHNDLENVGYTARHHTFFEMLGNFSFGDYFKAEAIAFAWRFLTERLGLAPERLWVTVFHEDAEAERIWLEDIGVDPARFSRLGERDNFWSMGDTGPCGPCSEIFFDHGPEVAGGPPGSPDEDGDRYIEIWNLVFMQFNRTADGTLEPLPSPSVDTGMGLERIAAVMQGVHSNYGIDLFQSLLRSVAQVVGVEAGSSNSLKVIADHIRSSAFLIADGVVPSNEGRGYVLRRIVRRALRHGHKLGQQGLFFHRLVAPLVQEMGGAYPELAAAQGRIEQTLTAEEEQFARTLDQGMRILEDAIAGVEGDSLAGEVVFRLYDTYGFPEDLTADICRERGLQIDRVGFEREMESQRKRARAASQFASAPAAQLRIQGSTEFVGYQALDGEAEVVALVGPEAEVERLVAGETGWLVLNRSPFYAESGGQVGDQGSLETPTAHAEVLDTQRQGDQILHRVQVREGSIGVGERVRSRIDSARRQATARNHSATHLLHAALREALGGHVQQKGSLVDPERLRFDFTHAEPLSTAQIHAIEARVNAEIRRNTPVETELMDLEEAKQQGAVALFGEKYAQQVRVLSMGAGFSKELCGGTHVHRTGDIGLFRISSESSVAAGVRRIEAVTGEQAVARMREDAGLLAELAALLRTPEAKLPERVSALIDQLREQDRELDRMKAKLATSSGSDLLDQTQQVEGISLLVHALDDADPKSLRNTLDYLKQKLGSGVIVLATERAGKVNLVAGVTGDLESRVHAGQLLGEIAALVGGRGGGRADMAQGGGDQPEALAAALNQVPDLVAQRLLAAAH
ncbi:MAG: alanine--tRNA ligase [Pseudomonadota bacterium]|nr:alanine--tRNA ligase [Pseudomonadota bacterium]